MWNMGKQKKKPKKSIWPISVWKDAQIHYHQIMQIKKSKVPFHIHHISKMYNLTTPREDQCACTRQWELSTTPTHRHSGPQLAVWLAGHERKLGSSKATSRYKLSYIFIRSHRKGHYLQHYFKWRKNGNKLKAQ